MVHMLEVLGVNWPVSFIFMNMSLLNKNGILIDVRITDKFGRELSTQC